MKKRNMSKFTAIVLLITMLTLIALAGTYAKYTSSFNGTGTATAADWSIEVSNDGTTFSETFTVTASEDIYPGGTGKLGTVTVKNTSSLVKAKIVDVQISDIQVNSVANPITNLTIANPDVSTQTLIAPADTATFDINYNWSYTETDETEYAEKPVTFTVTVTVDQVVD